MALGKLLQFDLRLFSDALIEIQILGEWNLSGVHGAAVLNDMNQGELGTILLLQFNCFFNHRAFFI